MLLYGAYALVDGVAMLATGAHTRSWIMVLAGTVGIAIGIVTFIHPEFMICWLLVLLASWSILQGILEIAFAVGLRRDLAGGWLIFVAGCLATAFSVLLLRDLRVGAISVIWLIGSYALAFGALMIVSAFRQRLMKNPATTFPSWIVT